MNASGPTTLLIAALGGEGGGLLTDWIVAAATAADLVVQSTSIPGVAQRTGATTYYIEIQPRESGRPADAEPVMSLYPSPGNVDVMVASELLETGRAVENGFVSPDRTTLIASTHRIYSITEKSAMADGTYDGELALTAARKMARRAILADLDRLARDHGTLLNAVFLGIIAGTADLPIPRQTFEAAISERGVAVESNLRGFALGLAYAAGEIEAPATPPAPARSWETKALKVDDLVARVRHGFPPETHDILEQGLKRLADYQDVAYARAYLERVERVLEADRRRGGVPRHELVREAGRYLALWMSYEDVIRVADLKTRAERLQKVRAEVGAGPDEPVRITEFMKPGIEEVCALLPPALARPLLSWAERRGLKDRLHMRMRVKTHTVSGFLRLWLLARLRPWRRRTHRFGEEQALIDRWLEAVRKAATLDQDLALEIVECANLNKGYGETHSRGRGNFLRIFEELIEPALAPGGDPGRQAEAIGRAREAALADPEGASLEVALAEPPLAPEAPRQAAGE